MSAPAEDVTFRQIVDNVTVIVSAKDESILPANAELTVTKIKEEDQVQKVKEAVAEDIAANNTTIQDMMVFDIKFLVDGREVQPNGTVTVEFENTGYESENGISVYHVDNANSTAVNMNATTEAEADVTFETTHFSTYVVINRGSNEITATIEHYLNGNNNTSTPLYRTQTVQIPSGEVEGQMANFTQESDEFALDKVVIIQDDGQEEEVTGDTIAVESNVTLRCYYNATDGSYQNETTFFDYDLRSQETEYSSFYCNQHVTITVGGKTYSQYYYRNNALYKNKSGGSSVYKFLEGDTFVYEDVTCTWQGDGQYSYTTVSNNFNNGINSEENYENSNKNNRLAVGDTGATTDYTYYVSCDGDRYNANVNNRGDDWNHPIIPGLISGLSGENFENVDFVPDEPGFFSADSKEGKRIIDGYDLVFDRSGNTYTLKSVLDDNDQTVVTNLSKFWPLDDELGIDGKQKSDAADGGGEHNWYFGMRYDFQFSLGDYVGDLTYTFNGDDDLWVFLDGKLTCCAS